MPSPERGGSRNPEKEPSHYYQAARFVSEQSSGRAYLQTQDLIFRTPDCDLSAYRLQLEHIWHVVVLGAQPGQEIQRQIDEILSTGQLISLPPEIVSILKDRREEAVKKGPWVERHHRPGKHL